jgi:hypothetical protein
MANKNDFTSEEWTQVLESMMLTGIAVSAADPNGFWDALKEALATSSTLAVSKLDPACNELVRMAVVDFETSEGRVRVQKALRVRFADAGPAECVHRSLESLRQVSAILDAKAPGDAVAFKTWLCDLGQTVAEASMEGTILGFGGVRVSDSEKATLADISKSLGMTA